MFILRKYEPKGRQQLVTISLPSSQANFIKKHIKKFSDKKRDIEYSLEDFLTTFVEDFYNAETNKTKEQLESDKNAYYEMLEKQNREADFARRKEAIAQRRKDIEEDEKKLAEEEKELYAPTA